MQESISGQLSFLKVTTGIPVTLAASMLAESARLASCCQQAAHLALPPMD